MIENSLYYQTEASADVVHKYGTNHQSPNHRKRIQTAINRARTKENKKKLERGIER